MQEKPACAEGGPDHDEPLPWALNCGRDKQEEHISGREVPMVWWWESCVHVCVCGGGGR